jgi:hypothetical protein
MNTISQKLNDLNSLVVSGKLIEAFEKYYDDNVSMQENAGAPLIGKKENYQRELEFLGNIVEFRKAAVIDMAIGDDVSYVTWQFDYTHKDWGVRNYTQVSVQHWKEGKIIHEQFFYGN